MKIAIDKRVSDLQAEFAKAFPLLKIKFYRKANDPYTGSHKKDEVSDDTPIRRLNPGLTEGVIYLRRSMSVTTFEARMEERYGLHVQVFRKSGEQWIQTSATDHWTLGKHQSVAQDTEEFISGIRQ